MALSFGSLFASLTLESASFMSGTAAARKELAKTQKAFADVGKKLNTAGTVMSAAITAPFAALVGTSIPAAIESAQAAAQVNAALASMGPVAGRTSEQLAGLAGHLQDISLFDDDDIMKSVTANLLTFGKVSGDVFDRAELAVVNLSARLGQDLQSSAIQVGKALNDPIKGVTALQRVGVSFTAQQREQIAAMTQAGDVAGAQGMILGELEKQFGGAAEAQRKATPGADTQQAWRTFQENIGAIGLKILPALNEALSGLLNAFNSLSPATQGVVVGVTAFVAAVGPVLIVTGSIVSAIGVLTPVIVAMGAAFLAAIPAVGGFVIAMAPVLLPIAAVSAAIVGIVLAIRNWDKIQPYVDKVVGWMGALYQGVKTWVIDKLGAVWRAMTLPIETVKRAFYGLYDAVVGHSYVPDMVTEIGQHFARLDTLMVQPAQAMTAKAAEAFEALRGRVQGVLDGLFPEEAKVRDITAKIDDLDRAFAEHLIKPKVWQSARDRLRAELQDAMRGAEGAATPAGPFDDATLGVPTSAIDDWKSNLPDLSTLARKTTAEVVESFAGMARDVASSLGSLVQNIKSGDWLSALSSVLDVVQQVSGLISGTKTPAASTYSLNLAGARAGGGSVLPNRSYLVGERGPEILRMGGSGGSIVPNHEIGGTDRMIIEPSPWFDVRAAGAAEPAIQSMGVRAAAGGSQMAQTNAARAARRRITR